MKKPFEMTKYYLVILLTTFAYLSIKAKVSDSLNDHSDPDTVCISAFIPSCDVPSGLAIVQSTQNALEVRWESTGVSTSIFELVRVPVKFYNKKTAFDHPIRVNGVSSFIFIGLESSTEYYIFVRRVCPTNVQNEFDYSEWVRITGKTSAYILSDCGTDSTYFDITNIKESSFEIDMSPSRNLSYNGRRLLVRYKLISIPYNTEVSPSAYNWQEQLVYSYQGMKISNLVKGGVYQVYIKQLRNGSYMQYSMACPEIGPFEVNLSYNRISCNDSVWVSCKGQDFITLKFLEEATGSAGTRYMVAVKEANQNQLTDWRFLYHFSGTEFTIDELTPSTSYQISTFQLAGMSGFNYTGICSEYPLGAITTLAAGPVIDLDGDEIPDSCDPDTNDGPLGDLDQDGIANQDENNPPPNPFPKMPQLNCGIPANIPVADPSQLLATADSGQVFFINGFPILVTAVSGANGIFSGEGIIGLPFSSKYLRVSFNNITVTKEMVVAAGSILGLSENLNNFPNLTLDTISFGEKNFCTVEPEEEGFDENGINSSNNSQFNQLGFDANGNYKKPPYQGWQEGDPYDPNYDPNGFNAQGIHFSTQTLYNENGCSQVGLTAEGNSCDPGTQGPYYWLAPGTTVEGIALANQVKDSLRPVVIAYLDALHQKMTDSINVVKINCNLIRDTVKTHFYSLEYTDDRDREFIFGPDDEWFKEGMSKAFRETPKKYNIQTDRNVGMDSLEEAHIRLYHCDVLLSRLEDLKTIITQLKGEPRITDFVTELLKQIRTFNAQQAKDFGSIEKLKPWIYSKTDSVILAEYEQFFSIGSVHVRKPQERKPFNPASDRSLGLLAADFDTPYTSNLLIQQSIGINKADIQFAYMQGWQEIAGVDRAYYLEAIAKARTLQAPPPGNMQEGVSFMPLEISKDVMGHTYRLYLDNISFTPGGGAADIYIIINTNPSPDRLVFKALNVPFGPSGFTGNTRLVLGTNLSITLSNAMKMNIFGNDSTYVSFNCQGFNGMKIDGELELCRKYVVPLHPVSLQPLPDPNTVKGHFMVQMPAWGEFVVDLSMNPFALTKHDSIKWRMNRLVFDFSNSVTPPSVKFPANYKSPFVKNINGNMVGSPMWKGLYFDTISVSLPKQFGNNSGGQTTIMARHFIFDETGLSGQVRASSVLSLCDGNLNGWSFSIDTFSLSVIQNRLAGFSITGFLNLPIFSKSDAPCATEKECVKYSAAILPGNVYSFAVNPLGEYDADLWKAKVTLKASSEVGIIHKDGAFKVTAKLNGEVSVKGNIGQNFQANIPGLTFQGLILRNTAPYFEPGLWSISDTALNVKMGDFGLVIDSIHMSKPPGSTDDKAQLAFRCGFIVGDGPVGNLTVQGGFRLKAKLLISSNRQRWVYDGLLVDNVKIDASFPGVERLKGALVFFGQDDPHPTFGRGFKGSVMVDFQGIDVEIEALGIFGTKESYKYFMVDALAKFSPGVGIGVIQLVGFGGGASYHMDIVGDMNTGLPANIPSIDPNTVSIGSSISGLVYLPDKNSGISLHATVVLALAKEEAFNVNATFGAKFNSSGGLNEIYFKGTARFMDGLDFSYPPLFDTLGTPNTNVDICAFLYMNFDFAERRLSAKFRVKINAAGLLQGEGDAEMLIEPGNWFINCGTPSDPIYVKLKLPGMNVDLATVAFYFDIGKNIPAFPGLPDNVSALTGMGNIVASESLRRTGKGFATGMRFDVSTGDLKFLIFYASLDLGLGFDLMMQDYGDAVCANNANEPLGINGWYASGQMWAYVNGDIGVEVKLWGKMRKFQILTLSAAAALQAKFPKPFYARGVVGGRYRILGGLVKGDCRFEFTLGEQCQLDGEPPLDDQNLLLEITPADSLLDVSTLDIPRGILAAPLYENLFDGSSNWSGQLGLAKLYQNDVEVSTNISFAENKTVIEVKPTSALAANTWYKFVVQVDVYKEGAFYKQEQKETWFKTGEVPSTIPTDNIRYAWPFNSQYNFYPGEHPDGKGHIVLKTGQPEMFQTPPPGYQRKMRLRNASGAILSEFPFTYVAANNKVEFNMPGNLQAAQVYKLEMVNVPVAGPGYSSAYSISDKPAKAVPEIMYEAFFRVSNYQKFGHKVDALKNSLTTTTYNNSWIRAVSNLSEPFDFYEVVGNGTDAPLISTSLNLMANTWFQQQQNRLKIAYNYYNGQGDIPCSVGDFELAPDVFGQLNLFALPIGFENPPQLAPVKLSPEGALPDLGSGTAQQYIDFTTINEWSEMWKVTNMALQGFKYMRCTGSNFGQSNPVCGSFTPCCSSFGSSNCCTTQCVFGGNTTLEYLTDNANMPQPAAGSKFPIGIQFAIPGYGLTTSKSIEIVKP